ncbi:hypothetical protein RFI_20771 [Reticulomyxa filosa]|uniref:Uncharacterized protein n=1 Tax=Reticulomyxa filosa TaxID=46433 RepID=X6MRW4_RETFI|nr:hypothetical protein RFI_20771 [Reticulomyxa filosa]|eukprot:ETO16569.1 hypothetical protein RFI_20771 [Reticulomyxa filosa]
MVLIILGILALVSFVTKSTTEAGVQIKNKEGQKEVFKKQVPALYYIHRASILDTSMEIVIPWKYNIQRSDDSIKNSVFRGWYNFLWLSTLCFILSHFLSNYRSNGYVIFQTAFFKSLFPYVHELVVVFLPVYCWSFWAFFLQKLMIANIFGRKCTRTIIHIFQHILQTILIFGFEKKKIDSPRYMLHTHVYSICTKEFTKGCEIKTNKKTITIITKGVGIFIYSECTHWPFSQKLALLLETMCLYMKMHSYLLSNHDLYTMKEDNIRQQKKDQQSDDNDVKPLTLEDCDHLTDAEVKEELLKRGCLFCFLIAKFANTYR